MLERVDLARGARRRAAGRGCRARRPRPPSRRRTPRRAPSRRGGTRARPPRSSSASVVRLRDPDRRAEPRRLDEDGVAVGFSTASPGRSVSCAATGMPLSRSTSLKRSLSMASADAAHAGADVRRRRPARAGPAPCRPRRRARAGSGRTTSTAAERRRASRPRPATGSVSAAPAPAAASRTPARSSCSAFERPASVAADLDREHVVARRVERRDDRAPRRRRETSCSLERPPASMRDAEPGHGVGRRSVGRRCVVVSVVSPPGRRRDELPDRDRHGRALPGACASPTGSCASTRPVLGRVGDVLQLRRTTLKPALGQLLGGLLARAGRVTSGTVAGRRALRDGQRRSSSPSAPGARRADPARSPCLRGPFESTSTGVTTKPSAWRSSLAGVDTARRRPFGTVTGARPRERR